MMLMCSLVSDVANFINVALYQMKLLYNFVFDVAYKRANLAYDVTML